MKKVFSVLLYTLLFLVISAGIVMLSWYFYRTSPEFQSLFGGRGADPLGAVERARSLAARSENTALLSLGIFTGIIVIQILALFIAVAVVTGIRKSGESAAVKLAKLQNADIFLDLPLYIGLFGSVSSFMVMSMNSTAGQLIAYSSTLIGIIFCTAMRVILLYPLRSKLITANGGAAPAKVQDANSGRRN